MQVVHLLWRKMWTSSLDPCTLSASGTVAIICSRALNSASQPAHLVRSLPQAAVSLLCELGSPEDAVALALTADMDLATSVAARSDDDPLRQRHLWIAIARHVISRPAPEVPGLMLHSRALLSYGSSATAVHYTSASLRMSASSRRLLYVLMVVAPEIDINADRTARQAFLHERTVTNCRKRTLPG